MCRQYVIFSYNFNTASVQVSLNYERQSGRTVTRDSSCVRHSGEEAGVHLLYVYVGAIKQPCRLHGYLQNMLRLSFLAVCGDFLCCLSKMPQLRTMYDKPDKVVA